MTAEKIKCSKFRSDRFCLFLSLSLSLSLSLANIHTRTHTKTIACSRTCIHSFFAWLVYALSLSLSLSLTKAHEHALSLSLSDFNACELNLICIFYANRFDHEQLQLKARIYHRINDWLGIARFSIWMWKAPLSFRLKNKTWTFLKISTCKQISSLRSIASDEESNSSHLVWY